jgi:hypothetical protein
MSEIIREVDESNKPFPDKHLELGLRVDEAAEQLDKSLYQLFEACKALLNSDSYSSSQALESVKQSTLASRLNESILAQTTVQWLNSRRRSG